MKDDDYFDQDLDPEDIPLPAISTREAPEHEGTPDVQSVIPPGEAIPETTPSHEERPSVQEEADPLPTAPAWEFMGYGWKAWLGFSALFAGMTTFMLWPDTPTHQNTTAPLVDTQPVSSASTQSRMAHPAGQSTPDAGGNAQLQQEITTLMQAQQQYSQQNRRDIAARARRLDETDKQMAVLNAQLSDQDARLTTLAKVHPASPVPSATPPRRTHRHAMPASHISTAGWSVNTVYPGMAWLRHGDSTWAVQPGDTLQGLHITGVDVARRTVVTDHGVIH